MSIRHSSLSCEVMSDPCFLYFSNIFIEYELAFKIINKLLVFRSIE